MTKLNDTTLENVNGGLVLADAEGLIVKYVVDDATGKLLDMALSVDDLEPLFCHELACFTKHLNH